MDGPHVHFTVRTIFFSFLLLISPQFSAQQLCSAPTTVAFAENNKVGDVVTQIEAEAGITVDFKPPPANPDNPFSLQRPENGNIWNLRAEKALDRETSSTHRVGIICTDRAGRLVSRNIFVDVTNVNDNPPKFMESLYQSNVSELSPVGTSVGYFPATDADGGALYYRLTPESVGFRLESDTSPRILTTKSFDYDKDKSFELILYVQDTPLGSSEKPSFNDSTTINVTTIDIDNRLPWFQPCTQYDVDGIVVCTSSGYTGKVFLNEQQTGALELKPGPVLAVDGDSGINEMITYSIVSGNEAGVFEISTSTGNITMQKAVTVLDPITLTVLAAQETNRHRFATTTVSLSVSLKSLHKPQFGSAKYEGIITGVGRTAENKNDKSKPLQIFATDADYAATGGLNPHITYSISGSSDFSLVDGFLFMTNKLPDATYSLQVTAVDRSNEESATAQLSVEVKSGPTTTVPPSTSTTDSKTSAAVVSPTSPSVPSGSTIPTANPTQTTANTRPTGSTGSAIIPSVSTGTSAATPTTGNSRPTEAVVSTSTPSKPTVTGTSAATPTTGNSRPTEAVVSTSTPSKPTVTGTSAGTPAIVTTAGKTPETVVPTGNPGMSTVSSITTTVSNTATTNSKTPVYVLATTHPGSSISTTDSNKTPGGSVPTPNPSLSSGSSVATTSTTRPPTVVAPGGIDSTAMIALGVTLGVLLFIALVIMGLLLFRLRRENKDWKKIYESNIFRSSLAHSSGGPKEGIQYTNDAFQNDEDKDSTGPRSTEKQITFSVNEPPTDAGDYTRYESIIEPQLPLQSDDTSQSGSEKEVKPILTKERRVDEGYKSVWFKEDIDPDAKEEVVIIPDSRENDSDEEEDTFSGREDDDENVLIRTPQVRFNDSDGFRVKTGKQAQDEDMLNIDL